MHTLTSMLDAAVAAYPDRPFFVTPDESLTYAEFASRTADVAGVLAACGVVAGESFGIYLPSRLELALTYWAGQQLGAVPVPLNPMFRAAEVAAAVVVTAMRLVVTDAAGEAELDRPAVPVPVERLAWGGPVEGLLASSRGTDAPTPGVRRPDDPASMFFTSGTTGRPKAVVQTQLGHQSALTSMFVQNGLRYGSEVVLNVMPLFNNFGASGVMNLCVFGGATMVQLERWNAPLALDLMTQHGVTMVLGTPTIYVDLCAEFDPARHDLAPVSNAIVAGASAPPALIGRFQEITGIRLRQVYGATETSGIVTGEARDSRPRAGSIGKIAGSSVVHILDDDGTPVATGERGEIVVAGDVVSPGYFGDPEAQSAFTPSGWRSGDIGYVDDDGYYYLVDRKKDMIICGGNNIYPAEVEAVLATHSAVASCTVVGMPDERRGEVPVAVVVARRGAEVTADALTAHCRDLLAAYKAPRTVHFVDALPLGPTGKVLKADVRRDLAGLDQAVGR